ncbi:protein spaetzle-like isoform X1 [Teleopsis dalmanni]|uniref:protein spaetzle-like isoform X1 n=1 Tax=Teleopsis dalmanni TaxID=139649 RepID=UPI0018CD2192|nr:protein spaetzle-like isoform X1 [Teleopsis dalmanni]
MEDETDNYRFISHQQQQRLQSPNRQALNRSNNANLTNVDTLISNIFVTDNSSNGIIIFNRTFSGYKSPRNHDTHINPLFVERSTQQIPSFKVQRTSDGKLDLVFNNTLHSQEPILAHPPRSQQGPIIFKDPPSSDTPTCKDDLHAAKPFCTEVRNYPDLSNFESKLLDEFSKLQFFFSDELVQPQNVQQRINIGPDESFFCTSEEKIIFPKAQLSKNNELLFIVNDNDKFKQGLRVELCSNEGSKCKYSDSLPNGVKATCKQNHIYRALVAITPNGTVVTDQFKVPSCCKCILKEVH